MPNQLGRYRKKQTMSESSKARQGEAGAVSTPKWEASQVTLSTLGDVSLAATDALDRIPDAPRRTRWLPLLGFLFGLYIASSIVAIYTLQSAPWVRAFLTPLAPVVVAAVVFWRRQVWKFHTREWRLKEGTRREALNSLAHETANGVNAIRANLPGFREANSQEVAGEHLEEITRALARIDRALEKSTASAPRPA